MYGRNARLSADYGENAYIMITGINNFDFKLKLEYEITAAKPQMFEFINNATVKFVYAEFIDGAINYYKNEVDDPEDPNGEIIYVKDELDENGNVIGQTQVKRDTNSQSNMYLGHIYQDTSIFQVLSQIKNDMSCMRVFAHSYQQETDELGNIVYKDVYELINPDKLEDDNDLFDNYKTTSFGTGMKIVLYEDETCTKEVDSMQGIVLGDLNGDGTLDTTDLGIMTNFLKNKVTKESLGVYLYATLISDKDGATLSTDTSDLTSLTNFLKGKEGSDFNKRYIVDTRS